jgi:hypothetical protein
MVQHSRLERYWLTIMVSPPQFVRAKLLLPYQAIIKTELKTPP